MTKRFSILLRWTPRVLAMMLAAFLSIFALDVFSEHTGFWNTLAALAMHLIPTALVLLALIVAWRWPFAGGVMFIALAATYVVLLIPSQVHWTAHLVITLPLAAVGVMFIAAGLIHSSAAR